MASEVSIANSALQKLGEGSIASMTEDSRFARAVNACYAEMRDAELRAHPWNFARKRVILSPETLAPEYDYTYAFNFPSDCLKPLPPNTYGLDWQIEENQILTNDGTIMYFKYVKRVTDPNAMDVLFRDMLACRIAIQCCHQITQSLSLIDAIQQQYNLARREARKANAFENSSDEEPADSYLVARL